MANTSLKASTLWPGTQVEDLELLAISHKPESAQRLCLASCARKALAKVGWTLVARRLDNLLQHPETAFKPCGCD